MEYFVIGVIMVVRKLVEVKMKKVSVLIVILSTVILIGCSQGKNFTIESKNLQMNKMKYYL